MLPRRNALKILALTAILLGSAMAARAQTSLNPGIDEYTASTLAFSWGGAGPFVAALSTDIDFTTVIATGALNGNATAYQNLSLNTTHYFRVKKQSESDAAYTVNTISISTWAAAPFAPFFSPSLFTAISSFTAEVGLGWDTAGNPDWTNYEVQYATHSGFTGVMSGARTLQYSGGAIRVGSLNANTTYYFRVRAQAFRGAYSSYSGTISSPTLALEFESLSETVYETTAAISWTPTVFNAGIQALSSEGFIVYYSSEASMTPLLSYSSATADGANTHSTLLYKSLERNTPYFYRAGALNWAGNTRLSETRGFITLPVKPSHLSKLAVADWSATLGWYALPAAPLAASAAGYKLEASTAPDFSGTLLSSTTYVIEESTLTITLDANTTYYFRTAALNAPNPGAGASYSASVTSVTLANPIDPVLISRTAGAQSITVSFTPNDPTPPALSCEGYRLEASPSPFGTGGTVFVSSTADNQASQLSVTGLPPYTNHYLRLATLNWEGTPNYTTVTPITTVPGSAPSNARLTNVWHSSATATFNKVMDSDGYVLEASPDEFFTAFYSSATPDKLVSTLTITGLDTNKLFHFRLGSLFSGATQYTGTDPAQGRTMPAVMTGLNLTDIFYSNAFVAWNLVPSADHYRLEAATSTDFSTVVSYAETANPSATSLLLWGLAANTSYYLRAGAFNSENQGVYVMLPATSTLANPPVEGPFTVNPSSLTLNWGTNSNPADTRYWAELDDNPGFSSPSSATVTLSSAVFTGLNPNTYYWSRVTALNRLGGKSLTVNFTSVATGAKNPGGATATGILATTVTVTWTDGGNIAGTRYLVKISSDPGFSFAFSSDTLRLSATFYGLVSNASYYMNVAARNLEGAPTSPARSLGTALTRPAAAAIFTVTTQAFTNFMTDGLSFNWGHNGNAALTNYEVQLSTISSYDFSVFSASRAATGESCVFSGLPLNTTYWARVVTHGQNALYNPVSVSTGPARTLSDAQIWAESQYDKNVSLNTSYGLISVFLPKGSIGSSTQMTLTPLFPGHVFEPPDSAVAALTPTGVGLSITHYPPTAVFKAITLTLPYRTEDLAGVDRSKLIFALYDETNKIWIPLPSVSDTAHNLVTAQTWHLSTFQLMTAASEAELSHVKIYPNPYRPNTVTDVMHFTGMTADARIKVYTFLGELVRDIKADVNGMAHWDGLTNSGEKTASGVYLAFIQSSDHRIKKTYKIAIER
ncbi:MAG TPA: hypothetical protein PKI19_04630 [Elusimicrobiales bacterium]|nr:hypothetical protein [Elusimicrobiales bacterium]